MKVYTVEREHAYEEDFGGYQIHMKLVAVFGNRKAAEDYATSKSHFGDDFEITEWGI